MPMEITLHVINEDEKDFAKIMADLDELIYNDPTERVGLYRNDLVHWYVRDVFFSRYNNLNARVIGSLREVIDKVSYHLNIFETKNSLKGAINNCFLSDNDCSDPELKKQMDKLLSDLKALDLDKPQQVILAWY